MTKAFLLFGSNVGDRYSYINKGIELIEKQCGTVICTSSFYETAAWGLEDQPSFLNKAVQLETTLTALELLRNIEETEKMLDRQRSVKWGQRTLDIDILFYGDDIIESETLKIPHPLMQMRKFTLIPLCEIAPEFMHPVFKKTIAQLLEECDDNLEVRKLG